MTCGQQERVCGSHGGWVGRAVACNRLASGALGGYNQLCPPIGGQLLDGCKCSDTPWVLTNYADNQL